MAQLNQEQNVIRAMLRRIEILEAREVEDSGWIEITYGGTWVAFDATRKGEYRKTGNIVSFRSLVKRTGTTGANVGSIPTGYRPAGAPAYFPSIGRHGGATYFTTTLVVSTAGSIDLSGNVPAAAVDFLSIGAFWYTDA